MTPSLCFSFKHKVTAAEKKEKSKANVLFVFIAAVEKINWAILKQLLLSK